MWKSLLLLAVTTLALGGILAAASAKEGAESDSSGGAGTGIRSTVR